MLIKILTTFKMKKEVSNKSPMLNKIVKKMRENQTKKTKTINIINLNVRSH